MRKAVLDVGSNSVLLLIEERTPTGWRVLHEATAVTSLGFETKRTGVLSEKGMSATLQAIELFFKTAQDYGAHSIDAAATMAARIARNTPEFLRRAEDQGTPVRVLSGEDEAELGFLAVATDPAFRTHPRLSIVDPGGQSTELVTAERTPVGWDILFRKSYPIGTLGLKSQFLPDECPHPLQVLAASTHIDDTIGMQYLPNNSAGHVIVLGATGTNLVSIRERMEKWDPKRVHGAWLDYEEISKAVGYMMPMTEAERGAIVGMEPGREATLPAGALILERFLNALKVLGCSVSVRGWRHALLERS